MKNIISEEDMNKFIMHINELNIIDTKLNIDSVILNSSKSIINSMECLQIFTEFEDFFKDREVLNNIMSNSEVINNTTSFADLVNFLK